MTEEAKEPTKEELEKTAKEADETLDLESEDFSLPECEQVANHWATQYYVGLRDINTLEMMAYGNQAAKNEAKVKEIRDQVLALKYTVAKIKRQRPSVRADMEKMLGAKK